MAEYLAQNHTAMRFQSQDGKAVLIDARALTPKMTHCTAPCHVRSSVNTPPSRPAEAALETSQSLHTAAELALSLLHP